MNTDDIELKNRYLQILIDLNLNVIHLTQKIKQNNRALKDLKVLVETFPTLAGAADNLPSEDPKNFISEQSTAPDPATSNAIDLQNPHRLLSLQEFSKITGPDGPSRRTLNKWTGPNAGINPLSNANVKCLRIGRKKFFRSCDVKRFLENPTK